MTTSKKTILITGCSSGIGQAAAMAFRDKGWRVIATARKQADIERLASDLGVEAISLELGDLSSVQSCAERVLSMTGGRLDALYNNAAYGQIGAMEDIRGDVLSRHLDVNVVGPHELTRLLIPAMRQQGHGRIVNCSSVLGLVSGPYRGPYCASKFALEAITDALRYELAGTGIHVSLLEPGPIYTKFLETTLTQFRAAIDMENSPHREVYEKRLAAMANDTQSKLKMGPGAVVKALIHAVESPKPKARYRISPHTHAIALMKRLLPGRTLDAIMKRT
ncbi:MAG TPA: SDR family NAD(P)-dependent oxidoreductase [Hyphomicrobiaceae bacterium]|nr:SDR family NAD(P)-dependent oxidoreductase [Hyphomicrobiaceae bacterium]